MVKLYLGAVLIFFLSMNMVFASNIIIVRKSNYLNGSGWTNDSNTTSTSLNVNVQNLLFVNSSNIGIGTLTPGAPVEIYHAGGTINGPLKLIKDGMINLFTIEGYRPTTMNFATIEWKGAKGNYTNPASLTANGQIGGFSVNGYTGTGWTGTNTFFGVFAGSVDWSNTTRAPFYINFRTKPVGTTAPSERMRIDENGYVGIGTTAPTYPLQVGTNVSGISIYSAGNVSAKGYNTRTSIYDKTSGLALDKIKDASEYLDVKGEIDHSKFYGYQGEAITADYSRPVTIKNGDEEIIIYPYTKTEGQISLNMEIDLLRQAVYELNAKVEALSATK